MRTIQAGAVLTLALLAACGGRQGSAKLSGALFPRIPVFEPSRLSDRESVSYSAGDSFDSLQRYEGMRWELSTDAPYAEVVEFYARSVPPEPAEENDDEADLGAGRDDDDDEGGEPAPESRVFVLHPEGPKRDLHVEITVEQAGRGACIRILESYLASRT